MRSPKLVNLQQLRARHLTSLKSTLKLATASNDQYRQELFVLINYAGQVKAYQLPLLSNPNAWPGGAAAYQQMQSTWADMTGKLQGWALSTLKNVIELPQMLLQNSTQVVIPSLTSAIGTTQLLIEDPNNTVARNSLLSTLQLLSINFTQYSSMTQALLDSLKSQATVFNQDAQTMQTIAQNALTAAGNDQQTIKSLNAQISNLQRDINSRAAAIAGGSIATAGGLIIGFIGIILAPATGGVSLTLLVPAGLILAGGVAIIAMNAEALVQDKEAINQLNGQISKLGADVTLLQGMSGTLTGFAGQVATLQTALSVVAQPWQAAEDYFTNTLSALNDIENASSDDWSSIKTELQDILDDWNSLMSSVSQLQVSASVATNANLAVGMDEAQVQQALNSATQVDLIRYLAS